MQRNGRRRAHDQVTYRIPIARTYKTYLLLFVSTCLSLSSRRDTMPCSPACLLQIDATQQQRQFLMAEDQLRFFVRRLRPSESSFLQTFGTDPESTAVPEQQFQPVSLGVGKQKYMAAQWIG